MYALNQVKKSVVAIYIRVFYANISKIYKDYK